MQLRGTQNRLGIAKRNLGLAEENVELVNTRFGNGVATTLDMAQARAQQATIAATLPPLRAREAGSSMPSDCCWASPRARSRRSCAASR